MATRKLLSPFYRRILLRRKCPPSRLLFGIVCGLWQLTKGSEYLTFSHVALLKELLELKQKPTTAQIVTLIQQNMAEAIQILIDAGSIVSSFNKVLKLGALSQVPVARVGITRANMLQGGLRDVAAGMDYLTFANGTVPSPGRSHLQVRRSKSSTRAFRTSTWLVSCVVACTYRVWLPGRMSSCPPRWTSTVTPM